MPDDNLAYKITYRHIVRDEEEFQRIRCYILNNPVKADLVADWTEWPFSYCRSP